MTRLVNLFSLALVAVFSFVNLCPAETIEQRQYKQREYIRRFLNGGDHVIYRGAFAAAIKAYGHDTNSQQILAKPVSRLDGPNNFQTASPVFDVLQAGGLLVDPPAILVSGPAGSRCKIARDNLSAAWAEIAAALRRGSSVGGSRIAAARAALANWKSVADLTDSDMSFSAWQRRKRGKEFFQKVGALIDQVEDPRRCGRIRAFLQADGLSFGGGTVGDLARHVLDNRLCIKPGSAAHAHLSALGRDLITLAESGHEEKAKLVRDAREKVLTAKRNRAAQRYAVARRTSDSSTCSNTRSDYDYWRYYRTYSMPTWKYRTRYYKYSVPTYRYRTYRYTVPSSSYRTYSYSVPSTSYTYRYTTR